MFRTNLYLEDGQREKLIELAKMDGISLATHVRLAIGGYLDMLDGTLAPVVTEARRTFPETENSSQAIKKAALHWYHNREANSKRGAIERVGERVEEDGAQTRKEVIELRDRVAALEQAIADLPSLIECMLGELVDVRTK